MSVAVTFFTYAVISKRPLTPTRKLIFTIFGVALLGINVLHAVNGIKVMATDVILRRESEQMLIAYLHNPRSERQLVEPLPYPWADKLKLRLDDPRLVKILPPELTR